MLFQSATESQTSWGRNYLELEKQKSKHLKSMGTFENFDNKSFRIFSVLQESYLLEELLIHGFGIQQNKPLC